MEQKLTLEIYWHCADVIVLDHSPCLSPIHPQGASPGPPRGKKRPRAPLQSSSSAQDKGKRPMYRRTASGGGDEAHSSCLVCFDSFPRSTMVAASLSQHMASSSSSMGTCGHFVCKECMRQYVMGKIQVSSSSTC
jgi:hypothetical protein